MKTKIPAICLAILMIMTLCACGGNSEGKGSETEGQAAADIYDGYTSDADVFIQMPALRQYGGYSCGTTCVQMIMNWLFPYDGDINLADYEDMLGTTEEGTSGENIIAFFEDNGVKAKAAEDRSTGELIEAIDKGHPVLMCIQAWSTAEDGSFNTDDPLDEDTYLIEGHWVICVGYRKADEGTQFYFNDPACVGHCIMNEKELSRRWIDMGSNGRVYKHYGIEIMGETDYLDDGAFHLD